jgi:hypothetical protein
VGEHRRRWVFIEGRIGSVRIPSPTNGPGGGALKFAFHGLFFIIHQVEGLVGHGFQRRPAFITVYNMKIHWMCFLASFAVMGQEAVVTKTEPSPARVTGPHIEFAVTNYDFQVRWAGETIKYAFVFTNTGDQTLEIKDVRTSCGCTTASNWTRTVGPGQMSEIPIQFNSANFNGPVAKFVTVTSNDPIQPSVNLKLSGTVKKAIDLRPSYIYFVTTAEPKTNEVRTVRIVNQTDGPLTLSEPVCTNRAFEVTSNPVVPGKEYELTVRIRSPLSEGVTQGRITLQTSITNYPAITLNVLAMVQPLIRTSPTEIYLPEGPLGSPLRRAVTLRNNGTNRVSFTEPQINAEGVEIQAQESEPGQASSFTLTFPAGFKAPAGRPLEFTVRTSLPQKPVVRVPVKLTSLPGASSPRFSQSPNPPVSSSRTTPPTNAPAKPSRPRDPSSGSPITDSIESSSPPSPPPLTATLSRTNQTTPSATH